MEEQKPSWGFQEVPGSRNNLGELPGRGAGRIESSRSLPPSGKEQFFPHSTVFLAQARPHGFQEQTPGSGCAEKRNPVSSEVSRNAYLKMR